MLLYFKLVDYQAESSAYGSITTECRVMMIRSGKRGKVSLGNGELFIYYFSFMQCVMGYIQNLQKQQQRVRTLVVWFECWCR